MISSVTQNYFLACLIFYCLKFGELKIAATFWVIVLYKNNS